MQSKTSPPSRRNSNLRNDLENSSLAQVLSQRLANMEQQLFLLRDDMKNAASALKEKDRQIQTLQNRIALAERRRELEEAGESLELESLDMSLNELSEGVESKSSSKRDELENEVVTLARRLEEMEKFFGDYGLAWVKEDALDEKDPNNLWIRKSNIHYTPDFDKVFLVVEELNLGNAGAQIVKKGNTAQFKNAQLLHLTLYADGIQLESNPFRKYDSPSVEEFFRDLEDGYFPTELKGNHPEGVIFKVKDKRKINYADDPDKRTVVYGGDKPGYKGLASSGSPSSISSLKATPRKSTASDRISKEPSSRRESSLRGRMSSKRPPRRASKATADVKNVDPAGGLGAGKSHAVPGTSTIPENLPASNLGPADVTSSPDNEKPAKSVADGSKRESDLKPVDVDGGKTVENAAGHPGGGVHRVAHGGSSGGVMAGGVSPENRMDAAGSLRGGMANESLPGGGASAKPSPGPVTDALKPPLSLQETDEGVGLKQLYRGRSSHSSDFRLPPPADHDSAQPKDAYGLPRPPFLSRSNTAADVRPLPLGPPSKQFENFPFPKTTVTQTSLTLLPGVTPPQLPTTPLNPPQLQTPPPHCHQPTHVTNITYNEAPITVQMTPSEFLRTKSTGVDVSVPPMQEGIVCPTHNSHPCNCVRTPCENCPSSDKLELGSVGLAKFPAETEYRQKFTESAMNNRNVLDFKKRSQGAKGKLSLSPDPMPRQPAATLLVNPDDAPILPDPVPHAIDPNIKWEHFTFLGHPKGQGATGTTASEKGSPTNRKSSAQVVQLNNKTSDRMVAVRMRTKSGNKEYVAHVYPDDPVNKLWSLLKVSSDDYSLVASAAPGVPLKNGSIGDLTKGDDLTLILSKNKGSSEMNAGKSLNDQGLHEKRSLEDKPLKTRKEASSFSKDGPQITNMSINIDSRDSIGGRSKSSSIRLSSDKKGKSEKVSQESVSSIKQSSFNAKKPFKGSKNSLTERKPSREMKSNSEDSALLRKSIEKNKPVGYVPKKVPSYQSSFPPEITPESRAKSLSKHLSGSSLHKTSFKESLRKLEVINEVGSSKKRSNNSAEGLSAFLLPADNSGAGAVVEGNPLSLPDALNRRPPHNVPAKRPSLGDSAKQPSLDIVDYPYDGTGNAGDISQYSEQGTREAQPAPTAARTDFHAQEDSIAVNIPILEPLPRPPDSSKPSVKDMKSGEIPLSGSTPSSLPGPGIEDVHSKSPGNRSEIPKNDGQSKPKAIETEPKPRTSSDETAVTAVDRENWHPNDQPPTIRTSDLDFTRDDPSEPITKPRTSYSTNDSEQIFDRYQPPEPEKDEELKPNAPSKHQTVDEQIQSKKKKKKGKSEKKDIKNTELGETSGIEAAESMKSGSAASVGSEYDQNEDETANELKDDSSTSILS